MRATDALRIVKRARRKGWADEAIAARVFCTTQTFRDWEKKKDTKIRRSIEAHLRALLDELRNVKGGTR